MDALEVVNERIRKRFKNPKLVGAQSSQVCKHASFAWCRALCTALCSITTIPQEAIPTTSWDQEAHLIVDLQVCLSFLFFAGILISSSDLQYSYGFY